MNKASELRAKLKKGGFGSEDAERIVKGEVDAGRCADDGLAGTIPVDMLVDAANALQGVRELDAPERANGINKGGPAFGEDVSDMLRASCANTEAVVEYQRETLPILAKGLMANGQVLESLISAVTSLDAIVKGMAERLKLPVPPRGMTDAGPILHPSEIVRKGAPAAGAKIGRVELTRALRQKHRDMIAKGGAESEIEHIGKAIGALENSAAPVEQIVKSFDIELN
jgi:hypothetical protein